MISRVRRDSKLIFLVGLVFAAGLSAHAGEDCEKLALAYGSDHDVVFFEGDLIAPTRKLQSLRRAEIFEGESDLPFLFEGKSGITVRPDDSIRPANVSLIAQEPIPGGGHGAKAVVFRDRDGGLKATFWQTYRRGVPNQIHHRDVAAAIATTRAMNLLDEGLIAGVSAGFKEFADSQGEHLIDASEHLGGPNSERNHQSFPTAILDEMEGFQIATGIVGGVVKVTHLDVHSSLSAAIAARDGLPHDVKNLAEQIVTVHEAIWPSLRAYREVRLLPSLYERLQREHLLEALREELRQLMPQGSHLDVVRHP